MVIVKDTTALSCCNKAIRAISFVIAKHFINRGDNNCASLPIHSSINPSTMVEMAIYN